MRKYAAAKGAAPTLFIGVGIRQQTERVSLLASTHTPDRGSAASMAYQYMDQSESNAITYVIQRSLGL